MNNIDINYIKQTINKKYGLSFSEEKDDFLRNSIKKFFHGSGFNDVNKYVDYSILLNDDQKIIDKLTTNFTLFYREEHHFIYLINALKRVKEKIKIWSAGCSTGEEVYSIAISIHDLCRVNNIKYKILGSDINCRVVNLAKKNQYTYDDIKNIYKKYNKFIIKNQDNFSFSEEITKNIDFKIINLKYGWNFNHKVDVIFCRNVSIYFDVISREELWQRMSQTLLLGGELYIGHSERIHNPEQYGLKMFGINAYRKIT